MSFCQCCLKPHPSRLIERHKSSIQTIKLIHKNCLNFENILLDEYEHLERISSNLNKYLMQYGTISNQIFSVLSQLIIQLNNRLENLTKFLYKFECLKKKCSIWLKNNSIKQIHSQLKYYKKQSLQMDSIEPEHMKLFLESIQLFSLIISPGNNEKMISTINIDQNINEWKEKNEFRITCLPNEHHQKEKQSSDVEIKAIEHCSDDNHNKYARESNLSWSFTIAKTKEDLSIPSPLHPSTDNSKTSQPTANITKSPPINRVRLAIEAIERNTKHFPRGRKS